MSWWFESSDARGRRILTGVDVDPLGVVFVVGFLTMLLALNPGLSWLLVMCGFSLFLVAKLSVVLRGRWVSFGSWPMRPAARRAYRVGYGLMITGAAGVLLAAAAV